MPDMPDDPYNELPLLPPPVDLESRAILKTCIEARAALAELRGAGELLPNQSILINSIPLLEAQASSEIENIVTTADKLFQYASHQDARTDSATKETLRYRTALKSGFEMLNDAPVSTQLAIKICSIVKGCDMDIRVGQGTALMNDATGEIIYTPPDGQARLIQFLSNWDRYIHEADTIDPLIRMAVMHYQFEAIHPFDDGNGRTGRILNLLFLVEQGLLDMPVLYLSRHIIRHKNEYYRLLLDVSTTGRWEDWVIFMLEAVRETAVWTTAKVRAIRALLDDTAKTLQSALPKIYSRELAEIIFVQPYCRIADLVDAGIAKRQTAAVYLNAMAEAGILVKHEVGRENIFINPALVKLLAREPRRVGVPAALL
jgi:Fic family protein